ncbi:MAG TPA: hypothetical protein VN541_17985, partial [Tepidisphaeraceae bacterium]|nr:hypothetical protein [Tepidisphaeraceae bacterium]
ATEDAVKSDFWRDDPQLSSRILDTVYGNFLRYHGEHRGTTYWMPYEEIREGSAVLQGMFDFLGVEFTSAARTELARRLR